MLIIYGMVTSALSNSHKEREKEKEREVKKGSVSSEISKQTSLHKES